MLMMATIAGKKQPNSLMLTTHWGFSMAQPRLYGVQHGSECCTALVC